MGMVAAAVGTAAPDPKALAVYGAVLRRPGQAEQVWLRFVAGRPVSALPTEFLDWACAKLEASGVPVWVLIWDNACDMKLFRSLLNLTTRSGNEPAVPPAGR